MTSQLGSMGSKVGNVSKKLPSTKQPIDEKSDDEY